MAERRVQDVTLAHGLVGKGVRSADWKEGLDIGLEFGGKRVAQLSLDLSLARAKLAKANSDLAEKDRLLQHWKAEAQWWREEHDKVHAEYCDFVKEMARRFAQ